MRPLAGRMLGQSRGELTAAVSFSLAIHVIAFASFLVLSMYTRPRVYVPPFYQVKLVDLPADAMLHPPSMSAPPAAASYAPPSKRPAPAKTTVKPHAAPLAKASPKPATVPKQAMPELSAEKPKKEPARETATETAGGETKAHPDATGKRLEAVAVTSGSQEFQFPPYIAIVRDKVERNWNPPPGSKDAKVTVLFRILRSGRVGDVKLSESSGNFYFDQAAMRAILASSPFPALPEGFFKDSEVFSVDLMERD